MADTSERTCVRPNDPRIHASAAHSHTPPYFFNLFDFAVEIIRYQLRQAPHAAHIKQHLLKSGTAPRKILPDRLGIDEAAVFQHDARLLDGILPRSG
jgi:hypothetical protein